MTHYDDVHLIQKSLIMRFLCKKRDKFYWDSPVDSVPTGIEILLKFYFQSDFDLLMQIFTTMNCELARYRKKFFAEEIRSFTHEARNDFEY